MILEPFDTRNGFRGNPQGIEFHIRRDIPPKVNDAVGDEHVALGWHAPRMPLVFTDYEVADAAIAQVGMEGPRA
jgi:hypothetical protein